MTGKRDFWAWYYGLLVPVEFAFLYITEIYQIKKDPELQYILNSYYLYAGIFIGFYLLIGLSFFLGQTWARKTYYFIPIVNVILLSFTMASKVSPNDITIQIGEIIIGSIIPLIFYYITTNTLRNRLFFRLQVPEWKLREHWLKYSNRRANQSFWFALLYPGITSFLIIFLNNLIILNNPLIYSEFLISLMERGLIVIGGIAIICFANRARKNVNLNARPPINGKGEAIFAIIVVSLWTSFILYSIIRDIPT